MVINLIFTSKTTCFDITWPIGDVNFTFTILLAWKLLQYDYI
jgi:hypothetical protein